MSRETLTGRKRYRPKWTLFSGTLMVLQLEYSYEGFCYTTGDRIKQRRWRDARPEDITEFA